MTSRMRSTLLALAVTALPVASLAQVDATIGGAVPVWLPFGAVTPNPTGLKMAYYVPATGVAPMPIVLALHGCTGHPSDMLSWLKGQADARGFMLAMPDVNRVNSGSVGQNGCWDVGSDDTFANATAADPADRSNSDPVGIYALLQYVGTTLRCGGEPCGDLSRAFVTGQSSGAMMTNVMVGLYPDVFKAGASYMGVPYGCWRSGVGGAHPTAGTETTPGATAGWSSACANGTVTHTGEEWAAMLPPYAGTRPRVMIWHGESDPLITYPNYAEQLKLWTTALAVDPDAAVADVPRGTWKAATSTVPAHWYRVWSRTRYGEAAGQAIVEAIHVSETVHEAATFNPTIAAEAARFFGLGDATAPGVPTDLASGTVGAGSAALTWTAPTDNVGVVSFVIFDDVGGTPTPIAWPTSATYTIPGLTPSTSYTLSVAAVDLAGNVSEASEPISFTTTADTTPPTAPTGLKAASITDTGATLSWTIATDDVGVTGYVVSRVDGETRTEVGTPTSARQVLAGLTAGKAYTFEVVAMDAAGHSSPAASVTFTTTGGSSGGGGGGGCGQGTPSGLTLVLAAALLLLLRRRTARSR
jgi:poly(hydroxyalkanoate) depolymerase family esterase